MKKKLILALLTFWLCASLPGASDPNTARSEWMGGFVKMEAADKVFSTNSVAALDLYKEALGVFEEVRRKYPQWNPALLNYRISYCQQKIQELNHKLEIQANKLSPEELLQLTIRQAKQVQALELSQKELQERVTFLTEALQRAREEASQGANLEATTASLAAAKNNLETENGALQMRVKALENQIAATEKLQKGVGKLQKDLGYAQKRQAELQEELDDAARKLKEGKQTLELARRDIKALNRDKENLTNSRQKAEEELLEIKNKNEELRRNLQTAEARIKEKDKVIANRDAEISKMEKGISLNQSITRKDFETAHKRLQKENEQLRAQIVTQNDKLLEATGLAAKYQNQKELAEKQTLRLTNELKETKILLGKSGDDQAAQNKQYQEMERKVQEAAETGKKLQLQLELARRQEGQIAEQQETIAKLKNELASALEKNKGYDNLQAQTTELQQTIDKQRQTLGALRETGKLQDARTAAAAGVALDLADSNDKLQKLSHELALLQERSDKIRELHEKRTKELEQQLADRNESLRLLRDGASLPNDKLIAKLYSLNEQLFQATKRKNALEAALVDMEARLKNQNPDAKENLNSTLPKNNEEEELQTRVTRERERKSIIRGFLRLATDAEKQHKLEAAQHQYQKVLELDPDNKLALQRLGLLAAGLGNDLEAIRYLKQAFKFDPDDRDTLLALGFAQARQGRANWAVSYLGRAVALEPQNPDAVRSYGSALFSLGWTQPAEIQLRNAYELKKSDAEAPFNLAVLYATSQPQRLDEAAKWYKIALQNGAEHDPGLDQLLK